MVIGFVYVFSILENYRLELEVLSNLMLYSKFMVILGQMRIYKKIEELENKIMLINFYSSELIRKLN